MRCYACHQLNSATARFCIECGAALMATAVQSPAANPAFAPAPYGVPNAAPVAPAYGAVQYPTPQQGMPDGYAGPMPAAGTAGRLRPVWLRCAAAIRGAGLAGQQRHRHARAGCDRAGCARPAPGERAAHHQRRDTRPGGAVLSGQWRCSWSTLVCDAATVLLYATGRVYPGYRADARRTRRRHRPHRPHAPVKHNL